jgi:hypothetical protein
MNGVLLKIIKSLAGSPRKGWCSASSGFLCSPSITIYPPPKMADPWIYTTSGLYPQLAAWQNSPTTATPPSFWIPNSSWQLANPGWPNPIAFFLPECGINLYSTTDPNWMPSAPSPNAQVTIGNAGPVTATSTQVQFSMSSFGIGRVKVPVASLPVNNLAPSQAITLNFPIPANFLTQQWLGAYVDLLPSYDKNLQNNNAISMWMAVDTSSGPINPTFPVVNEFSSTAEQITLSVIPTTGVTLSNLPAPVTVNPGQTKTVGFTVAAIPPAIDGGTFLAPLATVIGLDSSGNFVGGLTVVAAVND